MPIALDARANGDGESELIGRGPRGNNFNFLLLAFAISVFLTLLRLPTFLNAHELNVDESLMLTQGMKFLSDPVPWRSAAGTSGGPLDPYLISLFLLFGFRPTYAFAHMLATALACLQILTAYKTLLRLWSQRAAVWGILPLFYYFGFTDNVDLLSYATELLPALLLGLGFLAFAAWIDNRRTGQSQHRAVLLFATGLALGAAPWSKSQFFPVSLALGFGVLLAIVNYKVSYPGTEKWLSHAIVFLAGAVLPGGIILGLTEWGGATRSFWYTYVLGNIAYAGQFNPRGAWANLTLALLQTELLPLSICGVVAAALFIEQGLRKKRLQLSPRDRWIYGMLLLWLGSALFSVCRPAHFFPHYTILLLYPLTYLGCGLLTKELSLLPKGFQKRLGFLSKVTIASLVILLSATSILRFSSTRGVSRLPDSNEKIAREVEELKKTLPIRSMAIWGWAPGVYVLTGIPPATRDAIGHFVITSGQLQPYFRHRYLNDLRQAKPDLFIDAVAHGTIMWTWSDSDGYESDDELRDFINRKYVLKAKLSLIPGSKPVRFFLRREEFSPSGESHLDTNVKSGSN